MRSINLLLLSMTLLGGCQSRERSATSAGPKSAYAAERSDTSSVTTRRVWDKSDPEIGIGPDGQRVAYTKWDTGNVVIRDLGTGAVRNVTHNPKPYSPGYALSPRISRDGQWVAFGWLHEKKVGMQLRLARVDGTELKIPFDDVNAYIQAEDWSPDGQSILAVRTGDDGVWQIVLVPVRGGPVRTLKTLDWRIPIRMNFSPDGRFVVYDFPTTPESSVDRDLFVLDLASGQEHPLVQHPSNDFVLGWGPDSRHVLFASDRSGTLGAWLQEVEHGRPKGAPVLVKPDLWNASTGQFTADGSYLYTVRTGTRQAYLTTIDPATGKAVGSATSVTPAPRGELGDPQWSPDGRSVSYATRRPGTTPLITIRSLESGAMREIPVPHELVYSYHRWSSDGKSLVLSGRPKGRAGIYRMDLQTSRTDLLFKLEADANIGGGRAFEVTPGDGAVVYLKGFTRNGEDDRDLVIHDLKTHQERVLYHPPGFMGIALSVSPDGSTVAFTDGFRDDAKLMVVPIAGGEARRIGGSFLPRMHSPLAWSADGRSVFAITTEDSTGRNSVWRIPVDGSAIDSTGVVAPGLGGLRLDPSGRRLLFIAGSAASELWQMQNITSVTKTAHRSR